MRIRELTIVCFFTTKTQAYVDFLKNAAQVSRHCNIAFLNLEAFPQTKHMTLNTQFQLEDPMIIAFHQGEPKFGYSGSYNGNELREFLVAIEDKYQSTAPQFMPAETPAPPPEDKMICDENGCMYYRYAYNAAAAASMNIMHQ